MLRLRLAVTFVGMLIAAPPAGAAVATTITGEGTTEEQGGAVVHFTVGVSVDSSGLVTGRLGAQFFAGRTTEAVEARATCFATVDSIVLVGGTVVNSSPSPQRPAYSHLLLIIEDNDATGDRVGVVRFSGFAPTFDPCEDIRPLVGFIARAGLTRGDVTVTGASP